MQSQSKVTVIPQIIVIPPTSISICKTNYVGPINSGHHLTILSTNHHSTIDQPTPQHQHQPKPTNQLGDPPKQPRDTSPHLGHAMEPLAPLEPSDSRPGGGDHGRTETAWRTIGFNG